MRLIEVPSPPRLYPTLPQWPPSPSSDSYEYYKMMMASPPSLPISGVRDQRSPPNWPRPPLVRQKIIMTLDLQILLIIQFSNKITQKFNFTKYFVFDHFKFWKPDMHTTTFGRTAPAYVCTAAATGFRWECTATHTEFGRMRATIAKVLYLYVIS